MAADFTYYDTQGGYGACGKPLDAKNQMLAAVSEAYFDKKKFPNPNLDPICKKCVKVSYKGKR
jgi:hypothetical protein